jgi:endonuclease III
VRKAVDRLGGRYSVELGIDVDAGDAEVERWFVAATLFGARISATIAERTFHTLEEAGLDRIDRAHDLGEDALVGALDRGGYARYDFRTARRLHELSELVAARYGGAIATLGRGTVTYPELRDALDALPGWGSVTVELFLRELRGTWPGAEPPIDARARRAASHLGLVSATDDDPLASLRRVARDARLDLRDVEACLVRLSLHHDRDMDDCPGGGACHAIQATPA